MEQISLDKKTGERQALYQERAFSNIDQAIETIKKLQNGELPKIELNENEITELLTFESELCSDFEKIYKISANSIDFYLDYFTTEDGQRMLESETGLDVKGKSVTEIKKIFAENSSLLTQLPDKKRILLSGDSQKHNQNTLHQSLLESIDFNGELKIENLTVPERMTLLVDPQKAAEKITGLREMKQKFKKISKDVQESMAGQSGNIESAKKEVLKIYQRRINIMISNLFPYALVTKDKSDTAGIESLTPEEKKLMASFSGLLNPDKNRSRLDKLMYGATEEYNEWGWRDQIYQEILVHADNLARIGEEEELSKEKNVRAKGLDPEKIFRKGVASPQRKILGDELLDHYGLLSSDPAENFDPSRTGRAPDGKYQFVPRPNRQYMAFIGKWGTLLDPEKEYYSIASTILALVHEIEGHALQSENKELIPLDYYKKIDSDSRADVLADGGAMLIQDKVSQNAFGYRTIPHPHYIRAMKRKLEGGNYLDCIKSFYDSQTARKKELLKNGKIDIENFYKEIKDDLGLAINRSERLFGTGISLDSESRFLSSSHDTVYAEQFILSDKLRDTPLESLLHFGSASLSDTITLIRFGFLDLNKIRHPDLYALKIWEREKHKYLLEESA
ncbi:MAG: hypothetical protein QMD77_02470 [Patescibacteria group bacterium]|nr:hypothetical protein [Patescibacteria group bacterium]